MATHLKSIQRSAVSHMKLIDPFIQEAEQFFSDGVRVVLEGGPDGARCQEYAADPDT